MRRVRPTFVRSAHAVALALAVVAVALSVRDSVLFLPLLAGAAGFLLTPFVEWISVPDSLRRVLPRAHALVLLTAGLTAWMSRSLSILLLGPETIPLVAAPLVLPMWAAFALAPHAFPAGRTLVPAVVAALAFAGLNPAPEGYGGTLLPFPRDGARNGFAEVYLGLAVLVIGTLWVAALRGSGPRWSRRTLVTVALTGVLSVALAATAVVGLPLAQPHVEQAFAAALDTGTTGLSGQTTLGDIGALSLSRRRVLDLQASIPSAGRWRLPSEVFTRFDGRTWANAPSTREAERRTRRAFTPGPAPGDGGPLTSGLGTWFAVAPSGAGDGLPHVEIRVTQADRADWPLLLPRDPLAVTAHTSHLDRDRFGLIRRPHGLPLRQYGAILARGASTLPEPSSELSPAEREESLSLPAVVDPRIRGLAAELAPAAAGVRATVDATVAHLQTHYRYSLSPGPFRPNGDPLAEFLFEKKEGYCEYFASAAVVLLRLQGVPARYVKGLSVGPQTNMGGGLHVVRESDAHAWIEAWVPGEGWVEADPTPPGQFADARGAPGRLQRWLQHARSTLSGAWARLVEGGPLAFFRWLGGRVVAIGAVALREPLVWLVGVSVVFGPAAWRTLRRLRRSPLRPARHDAAVPADLRALVQDLDRRWAAHGRPRPPGRGRLEHVRSLPAADGIGRDTPPLPDALLASSRDVVDAYYRARFGGEPPPASEIRRLRESLQA